MPAPCKQGHDRKLLPSGTAWCPICSRRRELKYKSNNQERVKQLRRAGYLRLYDKRKEYRQVNAKNKTTYDKKRYSEKKTEILNKCKLYYQKNRDTILKKRLTQHPLRDRYQDMLRRCYNPRHPAFHLWGGRGIKVCDRWKGSKGFSNFVEDLYPSWKPGLTMDRYPDRNGNYEPNNVRWATPSEQTNNTRVNIAYRTTIPDDSPIYNSEGKLITLEKFSHDADIPLIIAKYRYSQYAMPDWILNAEHDNRYYEYRGHKYNIAELGLISGMPYHVVYNRIVNLDWNIVKAMETPVKSSPTPFKLKRNLLY